jgi:ribonuclease T2
MIKPSKLFSLRNLLFVIVILVAAVVFYNWVLNTEPAQTSPSIPSIVPQIKTHPVQIAESPRPTQSKKQTTPTVKITADSNLSSEMKAFDYFVLALSWSPDYCATDGSQDVQQCSIGKKLGFVLHGLWPQNKTGYPSSCSNEKLSNTIKAQFPGLYPSDKLYDHEWEKHGTCTGLSPQQYMALAQQLKQSVIIPADFKSPPKAFRISVGDLKQAFTASNPDLDGASLAVNCSGSSRFLSELYVCFSRSGSFTPCSAEVQKRAAQSCKNPDFLVRNTR